MALLYEVLYKFLLMLAPVNPMLTEEIYLKMFKPYIKGEFNKSVHLQDYPTVEKKYIDEKLEEQMFFASDLIEQVRAIKDQNNIRLRWPNKQLIIEPKENMPEIALPNVVKQLSNVKELVIENDVKDKKGFLKAETKYCNLYLDNNLDEDLLSERVVNDLIRHIQFSRKNNKFKVGENISLTIGSPEKQLEKLVSIGKSTISDKVTATELNIKSEELKKSEGLVYGKLNVCPNPDCCATLKDNFATRLKKQKSVNCPHCNIVIKDGDLRSISFQFKKE